MEEVSQLLRAKVDSAVGSLRGAASASWDQSTLGVREAVATAIAPVAERGQELWATAQAHYTATEELALHRARGALGLRVSVTPPPNKPHLYCCTRPVAVGVHFALEHPTTASVVALGSALVLLPPARRAVWSATLGRLRSDAAVLDSAQRRTQSLRLALDDQQKEMAKLTERAELASEEYTRGRAKLLAAGGQLRRLASTARSLEDKLAACVDDVATVRLRHGGTDAHAGVVTLAKQAAAEAVAQRATVEKHLRKVANLVPV